MTERDSEAPTETDEEVTPPKEERKATTRKVRGILKKTAARRVKVKAGLVYEELKIVPICDSFLYAIYSMNYLLYIYFMLNLY